MKFRDKIICILDYDLSRAELKEREWKSFIQKFPHMNPLLTLSYLQSFYREEHRNEETFNKYFKTDDEEFKYKYICLTYQTSFPNSEEFTSIILNFKELFKSMGYKLDSDHIRVFISQYYKNTKSNNFIDFIQMFHKFCSFKGYSKLRQDLFHIFNKEINSNIRKPSQEEVDEFQRKYNIA